jgi:hypothetical protein
MISTPYSAAQAKKPALKAAIHGSSTAGRLPASSAQRGVAPIAARSERLTASAFQPRLRGSVSGRKCVPATSMSVVIASSLPGDGCTRAQSSPGPRIADGVARAKYLSIRANSPGINAPFSWPSTSAGRSAAATLSRTPLTYLWPSVPPKDLVSSIASLMITR